MGKQSALFKLTNHLLAKLTSEVLELIKYHLVAGLNSQQNFQKQAHNKTGLFD